MYKFKNKFILIFGIIIFLLMIALIIFIIYYYLYRPSTQNNNSLSKQPVNENSPINSSQLATSSINSSQLATIKASQQTASRIAAQIALQKDGQQNLSSFDMLYHADLCPNPTNLPVACGPGCINIYQDDLGIWNCIYPDGSLSHPDHCPANMKLHKTAYDCVPIVYGGPVIMPYIP
jgi:hypothetical protein